MWADPAQECDTNDLFQTLARVLLALRFTYLQNSGPLQPTFAHCSELLPQGVPKAASHRSGLVAAANPFLWCRFPALLTSVHRHQNTSWEPLNRGRLTLTYSVGRFPSITSGKSWQSSWNHGGGLCGGGFPQHSGKQSGRIQRPGQWSKAPPPLMTCSCLGPASPDRATSWWSNIQSLSLLGIVSDSYHIPVRRRDLKSNVLWLLIENKISLAREWRKWHLLGAN